MVLAYYIISPLLSQVNTIGERHNLALKVDGAKNNVLRRDQGLWIVKIVVVHEMVGRQHDEEGALGMVVG